MSFIFYILVVFFPHFLLFSMWILTPHLYQFVVNASILPLCSSTIPTLISLRCLFCSFVLEAVGLTLNIFAVSQSLKAGEMFQVENLKGESSPVRVNVETYINFFNVILLVFSVLATFSCLGLVIICERALEYIDNKVDRRIIKATHRQRTIFSPTILKIWNGLQINTTTCERFLKNLTLKN